jgi:hypothetical protein
MALILNPCFQETCEGFTYIDKTGPYDATDNPGGYGEPNDVESPEDFDGGYTISVWLPGQDPEDDPQAVLDLFPIPEPDENGFYTWGFTFADLGVETIPVGFARMEVLGVSEGEDYEATAGPLFLSTIEAQVDKAMKSYDPTSPCANGCQDAGKFFMMLTTAQCNGVCDADKATSILQYIDNNIKNCC